MEERELLERAVPPLLAWYNSNKRDLPWRKERSFYTVLLSELMLQQTRVEAVKERYTQFLERFPTAEALAAASEDEVLKNWEGLGYYSRARNLHKAAKILAERGEPRTWVGVRALPGVGDYTAGAISSIALGLKEPAVDGNVLRILTRLFADGQNIDDIRTKKYFSDLLKEVYPPETAAFCEALMELGAIVCVPNGPPTCGACPWSGLCKAHLSGREGVFPVRGEKRPRRVESLDVYVLKCGDRYAVRKRGAGLLAGLWEFPNAPTVEAAGNASDGMDANKRSAAKFSDASAAKLSDVPAAEASQHAPSEEGGRGVGASHFGVVLATKPARHIFTHVEWRMTGYLIEAKELFPQFVWATASDIKKNYAIPSAFKAFMEWIK